MAGKWQSVAIYGDGGVLKAEDGTTVATVTIADGGKVTFTQFAALKHANSEDSKTSDHNGDIVSLTATATGTVTDGDGDTASTTAKVTINVSDSGPSIVGTNAVLARDDDALGSPVSTGDLFAELYGADGASSTAPAEYSVVFDEIEADSIRALVNGSWQSVTAAGGELKVGNTVVASVTISLRIFQFVVIHTVKFGIVNKAEIDVFWNSLAFSMIQGMLAI